MAMSSSASALRAGTLSTTSWRARLRPLPAVLLHIAAKRARVTTTAATGASSGPGAPTPPPSTAGERAALAADALVDELLAAGVAAPQRHPDTLPRDRLRALRAQSEELAKQKRLPRVQVGANGLTAAVVASTRDALAGSATGLVRVRLGEGCGLERRSAAAAMERLLDAVCVKQVGFVITLYRDPALRAAGGERGGAAEARPPAKKGSGGGNQRRTGSSPAADDGTEGVEDRGRGSPPPSPPPPPAFTVV